MSLDPQTSQLIRLALEEDHAFQDVSTLWTIPEAQRAKALLIPRAEGVLCGGPLFAEAFRLLDPSLVVNVFIEDGGTLAPNVPVAEVVGAARGILSAERVALNLVGRFSGIATLTRRYVEAVAGTGARICDTRKTTPLWRGWEKIAVRMGGGTNHRANLEEMVLLKDNHVALAGGAGKSLLAVKERNARGIPVEIEVDTLEQLREALEIGVERVLLDNMSVEQLRKAVGMTAGRAILEASGGVTLETVRAIAETGVDLISIGALTHSAPAFDFSLEVGGMRLARGKIL